MTPRRAILLLLAVFVVASAAAVGLPLVQGLSATDPPRQASAFAIVCAVEPDPDRDYCERIATDTARRTRLTESERASASALSQTLGHVLVRERRSWCDPTSQACGFRYLPADPDDVRRALMRPDLAGVVVRIAGPDDPAPVGRLLFAAAAGPACLLSYFSAIQGEVLRVEGHLPGGGCL